MKNLLKPLVAAAIRAPSGDNCQPWAFRTDSDNQLLVDIIPARAKSFFDFHHRATFLSIGAVAENIRVEAAHNGFCMQISYPGGDQPGQAAVNISLNGKLEEAAPAGLHDAMLDRSVNRRPFFRVRPKPRQIERLLANQVSGTETSILTQRQQIRDCARLIYLADRIRYSHPTIHQELFSKILLSRAQINEKRMGLEYDRLGIGPGGTAILKLLKPWDRMQRLSRLGADTGLSNQSRLLALSSGAIVLVTIPDNDPESWIRSGEQIERLWVMAQHLGLCVHPMTVALYLSQRYLEQGMADFLPIHEPWLKEISAGLKPFLGERVGAMMFRLGTAWKMSSRAVRLPVEQFLPTESETVV